MAAHHYSRSVPAFLKNLAEDGSAVPVLGHDGAVPSSMSELVLAFFDGEAGAAGDSHGRAWVLADQFQLPARQRMDGRRQE